MKLLQHLPHQNVAIGSGRRHRSSRRVAVSTRTVVAGDLSAQHWHALCDDQMSARR